MAWHDLWGSKEHWPQFSDSMYHVYLQYEVCECLHKMVFVQNSPLSKFPHWLILERAQNWPDLGQRHQDSETYIFHLHTFRQVWPRNSIIVFIGSCEAIFISLYHYSEGQVKARLKRSNFQFHKWLQKGVYKMQFELRNPMVNFILLCDADVWNMLIAQICIWIICTILRYLWLVYRRTKCCKSQLFFI